MQLRPVFSLLGSFVRDRSRSVTQDRAGRRVTSLALIGAAVGAAAPAAAGDVIITVTEVRSSEGVVRACLTADRKSFPKCNKDPNAKRVVVPAGKNVTIRFSDVEPGEYAVALLHDENNNKKADRTLGMIPREGYGFSRDAKVRMGHLATRCLI